MPYGEQHMTDTLNTEIGTAAEATKTMVEETKKVVENIPTEATRAIANVDFTKVGITATAVLATAAVTAGTLFVLDKKFGIKIRLQSPVVIRNPFKVEKKGEKDKETDTDKTKAS